MKYENLVQTYPVGLKWIYPDHGNFIAAIGHLASTGMTGDYCTAMQSLNRLECQRFISPTFAQDMNFSGYLNYAKFNYSTMLITDTAHYRNPYYNTELDTLDKLDLKKMTYVIDGLVAMALQPYSISLHNKKPCRSRVLANQLILMTGCFRFFFGFYNRCFHQGFWQRDEGQR